MSNQLVEWSVASLAVASTSYTITRAGIFEPVRAWIEAKSGKLGELMRCPYCIGHWLAGAAAICIGNPAVVVGNAIVDYAVSIFGMMAVVGVIHFVLIRTYQPIMKENVRVELAKLSAAEQMRDACAEVVTEVGYPGAADVIKAIEVVSD